MWWDLKKIISKIEEHTKNKVFWAIHFVYNWAHKIRYQASRPFDGDAVYTLFYKRSNLMLYFLPLTPAPDAVNMQIKH